MTKKIVITFSLLKFGGEKKQKKRKVRAKTKEIFWLPFSNGQVDAEIAATGLVAAGRLVLLLLRSGAVPVAGVGRRRPAAAVVPQLHAESRGVEIPGGQPARSLHHQRRGQPQVSRSELPCRPEINIGNIKKSR